MANNSYVVIGTVGPIFVNETSNQEGTALPTGVLTNQSVPNNLITIVATAPLPVGAISLTFTSSSISLSIAAVTLQPTASIHLERGEKLSIAAITSKPIGSASLELKQSLSIAAITSKPIGSIHLERGEKLSIAAITLQPTASVHLERGDVLAVSAVTSMPVGGIINRLTLNAEAASAGTRSIGMQSTVGLVVGMIVDDNRFPAGTIVTVVFSSNIMVNNALLVSFTGEYTSLTFTSSEFAQASSGEALSVSATTGLPVASINLENGESLSITAITSKPTGSIHLERGESLSIAAVTLHPTGSIHLERGEKLSITAITSKPTGSIHLERGEKLSISAVTLLPTASINLEIGEDLSISAVTLQPVASVSLELQQTLSMAAITLQPTSLIGLEIGEDLSISAVTLLPTASINLEIGEDLSISAVTLQPVASVSLELHQTLSMAAITLQPTGLIHLEIGEDLSIAAITAHPIASTNIAVGETISFHVKTTKPVAKGNISIGNGATTPVPIATFDIESGEILSIAAIAIRPTVSISLETGETLSVAAITTKPTVSINLDFSQTVSIAAVTIKPNASIDSEIGEDFSISAITIKPNASIDLGRGENLSIATSTVLPIALSTVQRGELLSVVGLTEIPQVTIGALSGESISLETATGFPIVSAIIGFGSSYINAITLNPIASYELFLGETVSMAAITVPPVANFLTPNVVLVIIDAIAAKPEAAINVDLLKQLNISATTLSPLAFGQMVDLAALPPTTIILAEFDSPTVSANVNSTSGPVTSDATVLSAVKDAGAVQTAVARAIVGHPIMIYSIPQIVQVVYPASTAFTGYFMANYPFNRTDFRMVRGVQNEINFYVRDVGRKPVSLGISESLTINITDPATDTLLMNRNLTTIDSALGIYLLTVLPAEMDQWPTTPVRWSLMYNRVDGSSVMMWTDRNYTPYSTLTVVQGADPGPAPTITTEWSGFTLMSDSNYYSPAYPGSAANGFMNGIQSFYFTLTALTGSIRIDASLATAPVDNGISTDWFQVDIQTFTNETSNYLFNEVGSYLWMRAVFLPDISNTGIVNQVQYRS